MMKGPSFASLAYETKKQTRTRDPETKQARKGNEWYFGMKAHVETDTKRGLVHSIAITHAAVHDSQKMEELAFPQKARMVVGIKAL